jgi:hypothetical protein
MPSTTSAGTTAKASAGNRKQPESNSSPAKLRHQMQQQQQSIKNNLLSALMMPPSLPGNFQRNYGQNQSGKPTSLSHHNNHSHVSISDIKNFSSNLASNGAGNEDFHSPITSSSPAQYFSTSAPYSITLNEMKFVPTEAVEDKSCLHNRELSHEEISHIIRECFFFLLS